MSKKVIYIFSSLCILVSFIFIQRVFGQTGFDPGGTSDPSGSGRSWSPPGGEKCCGGPCCPTPSGPVDEDPPVGWSPCSCWNPTIPEIWRPTPGQVITLPYIYTYIHVLFWGDNCKGSYVPTSYFIYRLRGATNNNYVVYNGACNYCRHVLWLNKCNGLTEWSVYANNGSCGNNYLGRSYFYQTGWSENTQINYVQHDPVAVPGEPLEITVDASNPGGQVSYTGVFIEETEGADGVLNGNDEWIWEYCNSENCTKTYEWVPSGDSYGKEYLVTAYAYGTCDGDGDMSDASMVRVGEAYNLNVNVRKSGIVENPDDINWDDVCTYGDDPFSNVNVRLVGADGSGYSAEGVSDGDGNVEFKGVPEEAVPVTLFANYEDAGDCEVYNLYCFRDESHVDFYQNNEINFDGYEPGDTRELIIGVSEDKKYSWETILDGDLYARDINVSVECDADIIGGDFSPTLLADDGIGGFARSAGDISSTDNVYEDKGGYALGLDEDPEVNQASADTWLHNFEFPNTDNLYTVSSIGDIEGGNVYRYDNETAGGSYAIGDDIAVLYVDGDLTISDEITSVNPDSFIVFVVRGNVNILPSIGNTNLETFVKGSPVNVKAGIIALGNIDFSTSGGTDIPIILEGFVMTKNLIRFNRDLEEYNDTYPAHIIKFYDKALYQLTKLEDDIKTGLATYDVQWVYE